MQRLEVSGAVRLIYRSLGVKGLICSTIAVDQLLKSPTECTEEWYVLQYCCILL